MPIITAEKLKELSFRIFRAAGASDYEAEVVAEMLVKSNLAGHDSHGVIRIPQYVERIQNGEIRVNAEIRVVRETGTTALIDGNWGFGQVVATKGMEIAIRKAEENSVGIVCAFNCNHVGRLADYATMAIKHDMIGVVTVNDGGANPHVAPWGGCTPILSTNPLCFAIPAGKENPIIVDFATSVVSAGKVKVKLNRGERTPEGWLIDANGNPTTDPKVLFYPPKGSLLPFGGIVGYKGYGLSIVVDVLSGALSEAGCSDPHEARDSNGVFMMAIKISSFTSIDRFKEKVDKLIKDLKSSKLAPGFSEVLIPGEPECKEETKRLKEGIFIEDKTWNQIMDVVRRLNVELSDIL